ncbi:hypothetical protein IE53DRAFT_385905 [Violaceomyces palustris]|uniref:Uncharacterized protein n=1 Tax=Violaceomyces palustris TaxID=1673888 RepID=A0ACD0P0U1_9BASI|nr:hypothetical protein IE53DRAFT_385905 [Violaceomyces palustris]
MSSVFHLQKTPREFKPNRDSHDPIHPYPSLGWTRRKVVSAKPPSGQERPPPTFTYSLDPIPPWMNPSLGQVLLIPSKYL